METRYSKQLGDGVDAFGPMNTIHEAFFALAKATVVAGEDFSDLAVFSNYDLGENMVTVYFSPNAGILARAFKATPCTKPIPTEMFGLLVGNANSWETYFPGYLECLRNSSL